MSMAADDPRLKVLSWGLLKNAHTHQSRLSNMAAEQRQYSKNLDHHRVAEIPCTGCDQHSSLQAGKRNAASAHAGIAARPCLCPPGLLASSEVGLLPVREDDSIILDVTVGKRQGLQHMRGTLSLTPQVD